MPRILVVEDDATNRALLERLLTHEGFDVLTGQDGARALALARTEQPDLIIMDMGLPIVDGWQVVYRLKRQPTTAHIPIIALTAYAMAEDREKCLAVGCDDYESKPIAITRLLAKIRSLLPTSEP